MIGNNGINLPTRFRGGHISAFLAGCRKNDHGKTLGKKTNTFHQNCSSTSPFWCGTIQTKNHFRDLNRYLGIFQKLLGMWMRMSSDKIYDRDIWHDFRSLLGPNPCSEQFLFPPHRSSPKYHLSLHQIIFISHVFFLEEMHTYFSKAFTTIVFFMIKTSFWASKNIFSASPSGRFTDAHFELPSLEFHHGVHRRKRFFGILMYPNISRKN